MGPQNIKSDGDNNGANQCNDDLRSLPSQVVQSPSTHSPRRGVAARRWQMVPLIHGLPISAVTPQPPTQGKRNRPEDGVAEFIGTTAPSSQRTTAYPSAHLAQRSTAGDLGVTGTPRNHGVDAAAQQTSSSSSTIPAEAWGDIEGSVAAPIAKRADPSSLVVILYPRVHGKGHS